MTVLDTAHQTWNHIWTTEAGKAAWSAPDAEVVSVAGTAHDQGARKALDVGAGLGRHALALARLGYEVDALDASETGLAQIRRLAQAESLPVATHIGKMDSLPFAEAEFDLVLSFNVIYHGDGEIVRRAMAEMNRVLKPGGTLVLTMLSKRNAHFGKGKEIAHGTFVVADAGDDKIHPHFYCNAVELLKLLQGFEIWKLEDREQSPAHWHWHLVAQKL